MEIRRKVKNVVCKYSEPERLVREATSNDPWGPTSTVMSEIADMTHDMFSFEEIMQIIWKRLNDKGKNWRHVYKCLVLLDYLIKCGDERVATLCRSNIHSIETLKDFQYFEEHKDYGLCVRDKSKTLVSLLKDEDVLSQERQKGQKVKEKFQGSKSAIGSNQRRRPGELGRDIRRQHNDREVRFTKSVMKLNFDEKKNDDEDEDLQKAIALSKEEHEKSMKKKHEEERLEDLKIKMALEQSKKEDEALAVLRLPPKPSSALNPIDLLSLSTDETRPKKTLYQMSEASRAYSEMNDFDYPEKVDQYDPWGASVIDNSGPSIALDFDPWKNDSKDNGEIVNSAWPKQKNKTIIDDIFGEDKPSIDFDSGWGANNRKASFPTSVEKENHIMDMWPESNNFQHPKNTTGSLASLTDIGVSHQDDKMQHSCSVMNLAGSRTKKTPQEFLGENANLINLENLLPTPKAAQKNPFGMSSAAGSNPFNSVTVQIKKPMNQMNPGGSQHSMLSSGNLPFNGTPVNYNSIIQMPQPLIPNSQSQYHGFPVTSNPYNNGNAFWAQPPVMVPSNQWLTHSNHDTSNPFFD